MANGEGLDNPDLLIDSVVGVKSLNVKPYSSGKTITWKLPPSKSHAIRTLFLASQSRDSVEILGVSNSGHDVNSMKNCLLQLGVKMEKLDFQGNLNPLGKELIGSEIHSIIIHGVGVNGFIKPEEKLDVGNSGTTLRLISVLCSRFDFEVIIDGDVTMRSRDTKSLWDSMTRSGVKVSYLHEEYRLPVKVHGPWFSDGQIRTLIIDVSKSSQPLSAWILSSSGLESELEIEFSGVPVSNRHWRLSMEICNSNGAEIVLRDNRLNIKPWSITTKPTMEVPKDASMASFAMLAASYLKVPVKLIGWPDRTQCIGHEILFDISKELGITWHESSLVKSASSSSIEVDITNCNDIITPLSLMLAAASGGNITGASHASFKESNRLKTTKQLFESFGMKCELIGDGLSIPGNQTPLSPDKLVHTFGDHRVFMSAYILACSVGADVEGSGLHKIADAKFIERISA